jgi:uracil phosphoribosyltransferase
MDQLTVVNHPLVKDRLTTLRCKDTTREEFGRKLVELSTVLAFVAGQQLTLDEVDVETPLEKTKGFEIKENIVLVPILRAGLGMLKGFEPVFPEACTGHIGMFRNETTLRPELYLEKLPFTLKEAVVFLLDPMLATGHSADAAIQCLKKQGATQITLVCCLASPEGVRLVTINHPDVTIITASLERELNSKGYILPGLGDAGDRQFGT